MARRPVAARRRATQPKGTQIVAETQEQHPDVDLTRLNLRDYSKIEAPIYYASASHCQGTGTDFVLTFSRPRPTLDDTSNAMAPFALAEHVVILNLSPGSTKDLAILLTDAVRMHEKMYGEIKTPFTERREATRARRPKGH